MKKVKTEIIVKKLGFESSEVRLRTSELKKFHYRAKIFNFCSARVPQNFFCAAEKFATQKFATSKKLRIFSQGTAKFSKIFEIFAKNFAKEFTEQKSRKI